MHMSMGVGNSKGCQNAEQEGCHKRLLSARV